MKVFVFLFLFLFIISLVSAVCEEGQIDINTASKEELMSIAGLGGKGIIAQRVIDTRPFSSVDDLMRVSGIKEAKLANIKAQGLACVDVEDTEVIEEDNEKNSSKINEQPSVSAIKSEDSSPRETELQPINLAPKAIKSEEDFQLSDSENKDNLAFFGLVAFAILLGFLFLAKELTTKRKRNELA